MLSHYRSDESPLLWFVGLGIFGGDGGATGWRGSKIETSIENVFDLQHIFLQIIAYLGFFFFLNESNEL